MPRCPPAVFRDHRVRVVHASEVLTMEDKPASALRKKKDCSIGRAMDLTSHEDKADAVISVGNTGGIFAAATFKLDGSPGLTAGASPPSFPTPDNEIRAAGFRREYRVQPIHLATSRSWAAFTHARFLATRIPAWASSASARKKPKATNSHSRPSNSAKKLGLNFIGNVEGHDLFKSRVDVVVCDGFVGNIVLKTCERPRRRHLHHAQTRADVQPAAPDWRLACPKRLPQHQTPAWTRRLTGGAPLLGFNGAVMKAHGSARERAISNAITVTARNLQHGVNLTITREIAAANHRLASLQDEIQPEESGA